MLPKDPGRAVSQASSYAADVSRDGGRRRSAAVSAEPDDSWVTWSALDDGALPAVCRPAFDGVKLADWAAACAPQIHQTLLERGAVLFRGFRLDTLSAFETLAARVGGAPFDYVERTSPRTRVARDVYTSTDYPASESILLHNENSYAHQWPLRMLFYCTTPAARGGATPLADSRRILRRLPTSVVSKFRRNGVCYIRNYSEHLGLPWQTSFQSNDRAAVEDYCRSAGIDVAWGPGNRLQTKAVRRAIVTHPDTGEEVWFNQALLFHASTLPPCFRETSAGRDEEAPTHATYGDGSPIEPETIAILRNAYDDETIRFEWRSGDVVLVDNMLTAHGREAFDGTRRVLVSMRQPLTWASLRE